MKKILVFLFCLVGLCTEVFAEEKKHSLQVAYEMSNYKYREPGLMSVKARPKYGVSAAYTLRGLLSQDFAGDDHSFATIDFRYMTGDADYYGGIQDGTGNVTPFTYKGIEDYYFEAGLRMGAVYSFADNWQVWPYFGFGWRKLVNHLEESGETGYLRESTYWYLPIGANLKYINNDWEFALNGEFDYFLKGKQYSGPVSGMEGNNNDQGEGYGVRVSLKAEKKFEKVGVFVEPFWRYWHIQNSSLAWKEITGTGWAMGVIEPKNYTHEYGLKIGVSF
ncbi:MAG: hypothetical protein IKL48_06010 [Elusimicrobiaceae bacterium]|nr:hypothetical protein [Elusimicrobiaceae bacterium]